MIKVTKHGRFYNEPPKSEVCPNCGCEFTYLATDCWEEEYTQAHYVECPECGHDIRVII